MTNGFQWAELGKSESINRKIEKRFNFKVLPIEIEYMLIRFNAVSASDFNYSNIFSPNQKLFREIIKFWVPLKRLNKAWPVFNDKTGFVEIIRSRNRFGERKHSHRKERFCRLCVAESPNQISFRDFPDAQISIRSAKWLHLKSLHIMKFIVVKNY